MRHDAFFFIGIFVFIFLIWVATGGPSHPISFTGPLLSAPTPIGSGTYIRLPQAPFGLGGTLVTLDGSDSSGPSGSTGGSLPIGGVAFGPPSPYRGQVSLSHYVSSAGNSDAGKESISISLQSGAASSITLSGWRLVSAASGASAVIPFGTEVPTSGIINEAQPIILKAGDRAIIISGRSPIGASFRENKCIGYFSQFQTFSPSLPSCPDPSDELVRYYGPDYVRDSACIAYVDKLATCSIALTPPQNLTTSCQDFLTSKLNYNGCMIAHQNDTDFKGHTWRVYLGRTTSMWRPKYEVVKLLDADGKTVDQFTY